MTDAKNLPARPNRWVWVQLTGGVIAMAIVVGFLSIAFTSMHW
jgi:hypothetical protein